MHTYIQCVPSSWHHKGHAWNPPEAPKGLRAARLGIPADLTLGSIGRRSLQDIAGMEVSNVFVSFLFERKLIYQCIQKLFSPRFFEAMQQNRWISQETSLGVLGGLRTQETKVNKAWNLPLT